MIITASVIMYFTHREVGSTIYRKEEVSAQNILRLVTLNIQAEFNNMVFEKNDILQKRKQYLKNRAGLSIKGEL